MAIRAITKAMDTAKAIAESPKIEPGHKEALTAQILQAATTTPMWDNWAQRFVAGGLAAIGLALTVFVGVAMLKHNAIDAAVTSALTGTIGGLAGMFTNKALSNGGNGGNADGGGGNAGNAQPAPGAARRTRARAD